MIRNITSVELNVKKICKYMVEWIKSKSSP